MRLHFLVITLLLALGACTRNIPREDLPYPLTNETFGEQVKVVTVPLPVIATSPNEGLTLGALTAFLLHNRMDEVSTLVAPQVNYNENFGITGTVYGAFYPSPQRNWEFNLSNSQNVNYDYEIRFIDRNFSRNLAVNLFLYSFTDGSARFFGFQSTSNRANETNYGDRELGTTLSAEYTVAERVRIIVGERLRRVRITRGAVRSVAFIGERFSEQEVPGIEGFLTHAQEIGLLYSTLDSPTFPVSGISARASVEFSSEALGSSDNYRHYKAELKTYIPHDEDRLVSIVRAAYNQTLGNNVPFLERSILGGETTLRAYGRNRFIDSSYFLINIEERIRVFRWRVFNVNADWEVAPFIDFGTVTESLAKVRSRNLEANPGIGFRAVVKPNIVGRVDVGYGDEGTAIFVGLNYPF